MSKRQFKSQASSSRATAGTLESASTFGGQKSPFGSAISILSYITEQPDLSSISESSIVVSFKNLSKKDSTTKAKALEDLQTYVNQCGTNGVPIEDGVLEAWTKSYPRTSIDSALRVRQLSHLLQGQMTVLTGKRMAKLLPPIIGAWVAGLYDSDRSVARAAQVSFKSAFPTEEKVRGVWTIFGSNLLEYAVNATLKESPQSLSDERTVSPDDAEAKYARVVATGLSIITNLLEDVQRSSKVREESFQAILGDDKLWALATHKDAFVRRSLYGLLRVCVEKTKDMISTKQKTLSTCLIYKSLALDQRGSSLEYSRALLAITSNFPLAWTDFYTNKTPAYKRLQRFLEKGSQAGPVEFWSNMSMTFKKIPTSVWPDDISSARDLTNSLRVGLNDRTEIRSNIPSALKSYVALAGLLISRQPTLDSATQFFATEVLPILDNHVRLASPEASFKAFAEQKPQACASAVISVDIDGAEGAVKTKMEALSNEVIENMKISLPSQSKDFQTSQKSLANEGSRWINLKNFLAAGVKESSLEEELQPSTLRIINAAIDLLQDRQGKPFGAAVLLTEAVSSSWNSMSATDSSTAETLDKFISKTPTLTFSPSFPYIVSLLKFCGRLSHFEKRVQIAWTAIIKTVLEASDSNEKDAAIRSLFSVIDENTTFSNENIELLGKLFKNVFKEASEGNQILWDLVSISLNHGDALAEGIKTEILQIMLENLSIEEKASASLKGFDVLSLKNASLVSSFMATEQGAKLISSLLFLTESSDSDMAREAEKIVKTIESNNMEIGDLGNRDLLTLKTIKSGLVEANPTSLAIETLISRASRFIRTSSTASSVEQLLPQANDWEYALTPFLNILPNPSTAITNDLGGSIYLIDEQESVGKPNSTLDIARDRDGFSPALRMALFAVQLMQTSQMLRSASTHVIATTFKYVILVINLANDNLGYAGSNNIWAQYEPEAENSMSSFLSSAQLVVKSWLENWDTDENDEIIGLVQEQLEMTSLGSNPLSFHSARALAYINSELIEIRGWQLGQDLVFGASLKELKRSQDVFSLVSLLKGFTRTPSSLKNDLDRFCGELISDLTIMNLSENSKDGLRKLVLFNTLASHHQEILARVNPQRIVFLVKNVLSGLEDLGSKTSSSHKAEIMKLLQETLLQMQDMYGSYWQSTLDLIVSTWSRLVAQPVNKLRSPISDSDIPMLHASLRLHQKLSSMLEANEDLQDAWKNTSKSTDILLMDLLRLPQDIPDDFHQPLKITHQLLGRQAIKSIPDKVENSHKLYATLYVESSAIKSTVYTILHGYIPSIQGEISVEAALSDSKPSLPIQLLSLINEAPTVERLADSSFEREIPSRLHGYLLSWILVFDHFKNSSLKVRQDYITSLQESQSFPPLLSFIFSYLMPSQKLPNISKFNPESLPDITQYVIDLVPSPSIGIYHLLTHLYYLSLRHIPALTKAWYLSSTSRGLPQEIKYFTEKYISPHLIEMELSSVNEYFNDPANKDDASFGVKVLPKAHEAQAAYEVDEQTMRIVISLPPDWPLGQVQVHGVHRVAVEEKRWVSWCQTVKAVIAFSNGSVVDGLNTWRKNVTGALKGQTECAICYSIISGDRELPSKRCQTCKNLFHGSCLLKWFKSSNGSSCPLCRNPFHYG